MIDVRISIPKHPYLNIPIEMRSYKLPTCPRVGEIIAIESYFFVVTEVMWVFLAYSCAANITVDWKV